MKKIFIASFMCVVLAVSVGIIEFSIFRLTYNKNKKESEEILKMAYNMIGKVDDSKNENTQSDNNINEKIVSDENVQNSNNNSNPVTFDNSEIIGVLVIPKLQIEAPIKSGTSQQVMKTSVGHFDESDYWNGNVSLASHNSGTSMHYFEKIKDLNENDDIYYITKLGTKRYKVKNIKKIENTDWSMVVGNTNESQNVENTITLITCINGQSKFRLCVRGVEVL